jgi:hypothetical protein
MIVAGCPFCPARLSMLPVRRQGVIALEFMADAWDHLADHDSTAVGPR